MRTGHAFLLALLCAAVCAFGADDGRLVRFGVVSDVHIGGRETAPQRLETALRWLKARDVDAVMFPGDIAHRGLISEVERFAAIWYQVFPEGRGRDGRKVEIMISTGNHDAGANWTRKTDEWRAQNVLAHGDNFVRVWDRLFHEKFELVWRKRINGVDFMGSQWPSLKPELEKYMAGHGAEFDPSRPFFHCQHEHPARTCHGRFLDCEDRGEAGRAFARHPNAVVFSGHSHYTIVDEQALWQGAFTSIGAGCCHEGGLPVCVDNCSPFWSSRVKQHLQDTLHDPDNWGGDPDGGCFEMVDVFADRLVVVRRSSVYDAEMGPAWVVPLPAAAGGRLDPARRKSGRTAPQFAAGAALIAEICPNGCAEERQARRGEPCLRVTVPNSVGADGNRVFTYGLDVSCGGKSVKKGRIMAAGFSVPLKESDRPSVWLVALDELPKGCDAVVTATPEDCFGQTGRPLTAVIRL